MQRILFSFPLFIASSAVLFAAEGGGPGSGAADGLGGAGDPAQQGVGGMSLWIWLLPLGLLIVLMLSSSRSQKREAKQRQEMIDGVKIGDKVITIGGMHGEVVRKGEGTVDIKLNENNIVTFNLTAVSTVGDQTSEKK